MLRTLTYLCRDRAALKTKKRQLEEELRKVWVCVRERVIESQSRTQYQEETAARAQKGVCV